MRYPITFMLLFMVTAIVMAQVSECASIVEQALTYTEAVCGELGRNEVCYGNTQIDAEPNEGVEDLAFSTRGDIASIADIAAMSVSAMSEPDIWGVVLMKVQANLPETLPGQNVTMMMFGDVQIENATDEMGNPDAYNPMQVIYFSSGIGGINCNEAPSSGMLIQTPSEAGAVQLVINEVGIQLGSTAYVQAEPDGQMSIAVLEGEAQITAMGVTVIVPAGSRVEMNLDAEGRPITVPDFRPYQPDMFTNLPLANLEYEIEIAPRTDLRTLADLNADKGSACTLSVSQNVNRRAGSGTNFAVVGSLSVGNDGTANARTVGTDGSTWYRLVDNGWVSSSVTSADGSCDNLISIAAPPAPVFVPTTSSTTDTNTNTDNTSNTDTSSSTTNTGSTTSASGGGGCSIVGDQPLDMTVVNNSGGTIDVYWIDYNCNEVYYNTLGAGESYVQGTFVTHPWVFRNSGGGALRYFTPNSAGNVTVTVGG